MVLNPEIDYNNHKSLDNSKKSRLFLTRSIAGRHLCDPFREISGDLQQAGLDLFLITEDMLTHVRNCDIGVSYKSRLLSSDFRPWSW